MNDKQLKRELRQAGATAQEIDELTPIASKLSQLKSIDRKAGSRGLVRTLKPILLASSAVVLAIAMVMMAQSVAPTSWLYPVQKLSDSVAIKVHPEYRGVVMMRLSQQVSDLVANHAPVSVIMSTLNSYKMEAADYKAMPGASYAAFVYCKTNLEEAAIDAPATVKWAIYNSLRYT